MIIVTGATGQLGCQIVESLLARVPADRVGVSVRDPQKAGDLAERGCACDKAVSATPPVSRTPSRAPRKC